MTSSREQHIENDYIIADDLNQTYWQWDVFELFYFFVMLIYAAQMTQDTSRMVSSISGNPIPFFIPIVLTGILLFRNPISFISKNLWIIVGFTAIWSILSLFKYNSFSTEELSYHFFIYYAIFIAYIHVNVYGKDLMKLYENMMVMICKITIPLWIFSVIEPSLANSFFEMFPETGFGHNFLYLFNKLGDMVYPDYPFLRNAGFSWEPGRFALMVCFAILFNFQQHGIDFNYRRNSHLYWLLIALITTESTTGYSLALILFGIHYIKQFSLINVILASLIFLPAIYWILQLDFMLAKITGQYDTINSLEEIIVNTGKYSDKTIALDRLPSFIIEWDNFIKDPLLGYSRNVEHSAIYSSLPDNIRFTGGLMQMFSQLGIFLGLFYYIILWRSSQLFGRIYNSNSIALFICFLISTFSYPLFIIPIFFAFWLFGEFYNEDENIEAEDPTNELEYE